LLSASAHVRTGTEQSKLFGTQTLLESCNGCIIFGISVTKKDDVFGSGRLPRMMARFVGNQTLDEIDKLASIRKILGFDVVLGSANTERNNSRSISMKQVGPSELALSPIRMNMSFASVIGLLELPGSGLPQLLVTVMWESPFNFNLDCRETKDFCFQFCDLCSAVWCSTPMLLSPECFITGILDGCNDYWTLPYF